MWRQPTAMAAAATAMAAAAVERARFADVYLGRQLLRLMD